MVEDCLGVLRGPIPEESKLLLQYGSSVGC
jgi:hypothetical protein